MASGGKELRVIINIHKYIVAIHILSTHIIIYIDII